MILIAGIPEEPPVARALEAAEDAGTGYYLFDQRDHLTSNIHLSLEPGAGWCATLQTPTEEIDLTKLTGVYVRLMDERFLPDVVLLPRDAPEHSRSARFHSLLHDWLNIVPIRIANRPQANLIRRCGFSVPETLVTNDPKEAMAFVAECERQGDKVVYKSVSGTRSIVQTFTREDRDRIHRIRWCPTQFQRKVRGTDVRVHVVGRKAFAARIESEASDYRYAQRQTGSEASVTEADISPEVATACIGLSAALELPFTGIDLKLTPDGSVVCFEANPCPAYSYYETRTGAPISATLTRWLACMDD